MKKKINDRENTYRKSPQDFASNTVLDVGFLPGTEGSGRISATTKAGLAREEVPTTAGAAMTIRQKLVAAVHFTPNLGALWNEDQQLALYNALFEYYTTVRGRNSSLGAYSQYDIFKIIYTVSQVYMLMGVVRQKFRVIQLEGSAVNAALPTYMRLAYNIVPDDIKRIAIHIATYNRIVKSMKALFMPGDFKLGLREHALVETVYKDDPMIEKSQYIIFVPTAYYALDVDALSPTVGQLVMHNAWNMNIDTMLSEIETLVNKLTLDKDVNDVYAELRKAFGETEQLKLLEYPTDGSEPLNIQFSMVMLDQLKNATLVGPIYELNHIKEDVNTGKLVYSKKWFKTTPWSAYDRTGAGEWAGGNNLKGAGDPVINPTTSFDPVTGVETGYAQGMAVVNCHDDQPDEHNMAKLLWWKARLGFGKTMPSADDDPVVVYSHTTELLNHISLFGVLPAQNNGNNQISELGDMSFDFTEYMVLHQLGARSFSLFMYILEAYASFAFLPKVNIDVHDDQDPNEYGPTFTHFGDLDNLFHVPWASIDQVHIATTQWLISQHFR